MNLFLDFLNLLLSFLVLDFINIAQDDLER